MEKGGFDLKINKEELAALAKKSDGELWQTIHKIACEHGYKLPENPPTAAEMDKIRSIMAGDGKINMREAARLLNTYKKRG